MPSNRDARVNYLADELGITADEAWRLKKQIEFCECAGPQRYELNGRIDINHERSNAMTDATRSQTSLDVQVGGDHYKSMPIQPVEYIYRNDLGFIEGSVVKYVSRWRCKGGIDDLKKARHFIDMLIEFESAKEAK